MNDNEKKLCKNVFKVIIPFLCLLQLAGYNVFFGILSFLKELLDSTMEDFSQPVSVGTLVICFFIYQFYSKKEKENIRTNN